MAKFLCFSKLNMSVTIWLSWNLEDNTWHVCLCLTCLMFDPQFARMEDGVCGRHGRPAQWPVAKDRSPGSDIVMHPCHNWGVKTAREVGERPSAALPSPAPVSIPACSGNTQKLYLHYSSVHVEPPDFLVPHGSPEAAFPMCFGLASCLSFRKCWLKSAQYVFTCSIKFQASDSGCFSKFQTSNVDLFLFRNKVIQYICGMKGFMSKIHNWTSVSVSF